MNKFPPGTLALLIASNEILTSPLHSGMIGEVKDSSKYNAEVAVGDVMIEFPTAKSEGFTGWWRIATRYLVPLGGSGIVGDEDAKDNPYLVEKLEEANV